MSDALLLSVVNDALALCGEPALAGLEEGVSRAAVARGQIDGVRDALLRLHDWQFAGGWASPAAISGLSLGPLKNRFPLPADCLKVRAVQGLGPDEWTLEAASTDGQTAPGLVFLLVTNATAPLINYTRRIEAPDLWDALFRECFALKLAIAISPSFGKGGDWVEAKELQLRRLIMPAARRSAQERSSRQRPIEGSYLSARRG